MATVTKTQTIARAEAAAQVKHSLAMEDLEMTPRVKPTCKKQ